MKKFNNPSFVSALTPFVFCFLIILFLFSKADCQVYPYQNYSVKDGLINSNVYGIEQDSIGYMWFATENGLSKFDGVTFENFSLSKLGISSYISSLYSHKNGDIYLGCGINGIFKFDPLTEKISPVSKTDVSQSNQIIIKDDYLISLHEYHNFDILRISDGSIFSPDSLLKINRENKALSMKMLKNKRILLGRSNGLYEFKNGSQVKLNITGLNDKPVYSIYENADGNVLIGSDGIIYKYNGSVIYDSVTVAKGEELRVRNILVDEKGSIWFNLWGTKDIFMVTENVIINVSEKLTLKNSSATQMFKDRNGNIWAGMLGKGIYLFTNMYILNYPTSDDLPASNIKKIINTNNGTYLLGTNDGMAILDPRKKSIYSVKHIPEMTQFVRDITCTGNNNYVVAITDIRLENPFRKEYYLPKEHINLRYAHGSSLWSDSSTLWVGSWDNSMTEYRLSDYNIYQSIESVFKGQPSKLRINRIFKDRFNRFWVGSQQGFCILNPEGDLMDFIETMSTNEITDISDLPEDRIMVVSNSGLVIFKNHENISKVKLIRNIDVENTTCVAITGNDEYLIGTKNGLYFLQSETRRLLTINDGILSDNINDIHFDSLLQTAYIATTEGIMELHLNKLKESFISTFKIDDVLIKQGDTLFRAGRPINFSYKENSFTIKFHTFNYTNPIKIKYQYSLDNGEWVHSPSREIQFASMEPGNHLINIRAGELQNTWGPAHTIQINILPPFYRTIWFYVLTSIGTFFLIFIFIKKQLRIIRIKQEEKSLTQQKLVELQQKALASNLNPHFIFNSLNSIQHFINSHNPTDANDYLSKFSRLMRMQLNMADKSFITLQEEISRLEFYLSLEQMRFGDKLTWQIQVDPSIDPYTLEIPNMIIQPFIENAIWHGIMPSSVPGNILLSIQPLPHHKLEIAVTDNGVGYGQHKSSADPNHESKGVKLITDRLNLLDPHATKLLVFENNNPGTKVTIILTDKMYRTIKAGKI